MEEKDKTSFRRLLSSPRSASLASRGGIPQWRATDQAEKGRHTRFLPSDGGQNKQHHYFVQFLVSQHNFSTAVVVTWCRIRFQKDLPVLWTPDRCKQHRCWTPMVGCRFACLLRWLFSLGAPSSRYHLASLKGSACIFANRYWVNVEDSPVCPLTKCFKILFCRV